MADVFEEVLEEYGFTAKREARGREEGREEDVNKLQKHGMDPGQIAEVLELPLHRVFKYLSIDSARH